MKTEWKISEYVVALDKILKEKGDLTIGIGDMDSEGEIVGLHPNKPRLAGRGKRRYVLLSAIYPLGCFGDPNE